MRVCRSGLIASTIAAAVLNVPVGAVAAGKIYVVDQRHPKADDTGPGASGRPFETIGRAATIARAGDRVLIRTGVYRESVTVKANGTAEEPIRFEAAPTANVIVTGANALSRWKKESAGAKENVFSTSWPHRFLAGTKNGTHPSNDYHRMIGRLEQVFVQGRRMRQVLDRGKLSRGTFYADLAAKRLYVWSDGNQDIVKKKVPVEASVRGLLWVSQGAYIQVRGIRFRYAANKAQRGAVMFRGDHGVVEDCIFEKTNSIGVAFRGDNVLVRRCVFADNGQMGFSAAKARGLRMTECLVRNNNTKGFNRNWEAGGNKLVVCRDVIIEHSRFVDNRGIGLWFDIGNENCVVRNCLFAGNEASGIFYEISYGLRAHDNVLIGNGFGNYPGDWGSNGAITLSSSPNCTIERNLMIANREGFQFREQRRTTPRIDDRRERPVWNHDNVIRNNVIAYNRDAQTAGCFDVLDQRHWPRAMRKKTPGRKRKKPRPGMPADLSLEKLNLTLRNNLYFATPGQGLFRWGTTWRRHKLYADPSAIRRELSLEQASRVAEPGFAAGILVRDLRVPADSPAVTMGCYPRGSVPGVRLGIRKTPAR